MAQVADTIFNQEGAAPVGGAASSFQDLIESVSASEYALGEVGEHCPPAESSEGNANDDCGDLDRGAEW